MTEIFNTGTLSEKTVFEISEIEKECFLHPWSETSIKSSAETGTVYFVYREEKTAVGYIGVTVTADEGYITNIAVFKAYRRRGIGNTLLTAAEDYAKNKNLRFLTLEVRKSNTAAISLYEKHGFETVGERKNYYENPRENALIMTRRF